LRRAKRTHPPNGYWTPALLPVPPFFRLSAREEKPMTFGIRPSHSGKAGKDRGRVGLAATRPRPPGPLGRDFITGPSRAVRPASAEPLARPDRAAVRAASAG